MALPIDVTVETRDRAHVRGLVAGLEAGGLNVHLREGPEA